MTKDKHMTKQEWIELALTLTKAALAVPEGCYNYDLKNAAALCLQLAVQSKEAAV